MKKVLYLIDANGSYKDGKHSAYSTVTPDFYNRLKEGITNGDYDVILYRPNIPYGDNEVLNEALKTDPVLTMLSPEEREKIIIIPNGYKSVSEWDERQIGVENELGESGCEFVCAGLYRDLCVKAGCESLKLRFPNNKISISCDLSRLSPQGVLELKRRFEGR
ncbi:MAG: hypothetical protein MJ165_04650 [Alphaproteobacteria bacterium]|nr:hypothetical protein [Alphaproteobacteria bacterium]